MTRWAKFALSLLGFLNLHSAAAANIHSHFNHIKSNPKALYDFFKQMPKGGELHYHLAGGPPAEVMLSLIAKENFCLNPKSMAITLGESTCPGELSARDISQQSDLYTKVIRSWSMEQFSTGLESGHDHFFNTFMKFMPIIVNFRAQLLVNVLERAGTENEHYMEIMDIADNAHAITFGDLIKKESSLAQKRALLLGNKDFQKNITTTITTSNETELSARKLLACQSHPETKACTIKIKFLYYLLREQPSNNFFAQALNGFEAVSRSQGNLIGINLVQPEDGKVSLHDYKQQMQVLDYLHQQYPKVAIALHAGEITPNLVNAQELTYHIHDAIYVGHAQRIGHGVDISYEHDAEKILNRMAQQHIAVEINLISNKKLLEITGSNHPLNLYLEHQVPVTLSTDDEGILRTDLSQQYVEAVIEHHLDYDTLKNINRNAITYAFIPGKSLWKDALKELKVTQCHRLNSPSCIKFVSSSEKAQLQWELEQALSTFESNFH